MAQLNPPRYVLIAALVDADASTRLKAALALGTYPDPALIETVMDRCAHEPDFYVRDMLTWAITRLPRHITVPRLIAELRSECAQARSQALHTLSKVGDSSAWPAITSSLLHDADDEVARSAWRAAVVLVPEGQKAWLAGELAMHFGRGNREMQRSLSRALIALGEEAFMPVLQEALASDALEVRMHASAMERLLCEPDSGSEFATNQVKRMFAPGGTNAPGE